MKRFLKSYPEIFFLNAKYKFTSLLYLVDDSVGESEVVGVL